VFGEFAKGASSLLDRHLAVVQDRDRVTESRLDRR
jgi:hypothetical protein